MSAPRRPARTRRSYLAELTCQAAIWCVNLYQIVTGFRTMSFLTAATAGMIFSLVPVGIMQSLQGLRRQETL